MTALDLASKSPVVEVKSGSWRWQAERWWLPQSGDARAPEALLVELAELTEAIGNRAGDEVLRRAPGRVVFSTVLAGGKRVVVKRFTDLGIADRLRRWFRTRAATEWRSLGVAAAGGVAAPRRLALGETDDQSILVLEYLSAHESLATALPRIAMLRPARRVRVVRGIADLIAGLHGSGLEHRDLHPGNIMTPRPGIDSLSFECVILDLQKCRVAPRLSLARRLRDLSDLDLYFAWHGRRADRVAFARAYLRTLSGTYLSDDPETLEAEVSRLIRALGARTMRRSRKFWRGRDARARRAGRVFSSFAQRGCGRGLARNDATWVQLLLLQSDEFIARPDSRALKSGRSATSALVRVDDIASNQSEIGHAFVKRYNRKGRGELTKIFLRGTRGRRALRASWALEVRGISSPRALGYIDREDGLSVVITEGQVGARNLADLLAELARAPGAADRKWLQPVFMDVARLLKRMHISGLAHRDLKTTNVLVEVDAANAGARRRIWLVDTDGLTVLRGAAGLKLRARDLERFLTDAEERGGFSGDDARLFIGTYLRHIVEESRSTQELIALVAARRERQGR